MAIIAAPWSIGSILPRGARRLRTGARSARANALEYGLQLVVVARASVEHLHVHVARAADGEPLEEVLDQLGLEVADQAPGTIL